MSFKLLIADDSLTIQKVIKITLANEDYEIETCSDYSFLDQTIKSFRPDLVLLDFNLSEDTSGYEIAKSIYDSYEGSIQTLMLYGTFDPIDENLLQDAGCANHIVKPFDGNKFINICRNIEQMKLDLDKTQKVDPSSIISSTDLSLDQSSEEKVKRENEGQSLTELDEELDNLEYEDAIQPDKDQEEQISLSSHSHLQEKDVDEWDIEVPSIIELQEEESDLNPIQTQNQTDGQREPLFPKSSDLELPEIDTMDPLVSTENQLNIELDTNNSSQTHSVMEEDNQSKEKERVENLKNLINQSEEPENDQDEDIWAVDEKFIQNDVDTKNNSRQDKKETHETKEVKAVFDQAESLSHQTSNSYEEKSSLDKSTIEKMIEERIQSSQLIQKNDSSQNANEDQIAQLVESKVNEILGQKLELLVSQKLDQLIEVKLSEMLKNQENNLIEKVAWETIPDLAENLIFKQLQEIKNKVLSSDHP